MNKVNNIVLSRRDFKQEDELYAKVSQQIRILLESGYVIVAEDVDEKGGTVVIQYAPKSTEVDLPKPYWLSNSEKLAALNEHINEEVSQARKIIDASNAADEFVSIFGDVAKRNTGKGGSGGNCDA